MNAREIKMAFGLFVVMVSLSHQVWGYCEKDQVELQFSSLEMMNTRMFFCISSESKQLEISYSSSAGVSGASEEDRETYEFTRQEISNDRCNYSIYLKDGSEYHIQSEYTSEYLDHWYLYENQENIYFALDPGDAQSLGLDPDCLDQ
ncbi:MAG: hypothetical protein R3A11_05945 [Bdellovibrionota bacterium]